MREAHLYKKEIDQQNIRLFDLYLDQQLIFRLIKLANSNNSNAFDEAIKVIRNYYEASEVAIYSGNVHSFIYPPRYNDWLLENYLKDNETTIVSSITKNKFFSDSIKILNTSYKLYVSKFENNQNFYLKIILLDKK
jgi:hypothetical protein